MYVTKVRNVKELNLQFLKYVQSTQWEKMSLSHTEQLHQ